MTTLGQFQKPESIVSGQNVSYTVPAGKLSRVTLGIDASMRVAGSDGQAVTIGPMAYGNTATSQTATIMLRAGDVVTTTRATGTVSLSGDGGGSRTRSLTSSATVLLLINGITNLSISAPASGSCIQTGSSTGLMMTATGIANFGFIAEEYFE